MATPGPIPDAPYPKCASVQATLNTAATMVGTYVDFGGYGDFLQQAPFTAPRQ